MLLYYTAKKGKKIRFSNFFGKKLFFSQNSLFFYQKLYLCAGGLGNNFSEMYNKF
jgi:hypothetical protein